MEFWRQNPNFGHGRLDKKYGFFPQGGNPGTPLFWWQRKGGPWEANAS